MKLYVVKKMYYLILENESFVGVRVLSFHFLILFSFSGILSFSFPSLLEPLRDELETN